MSVFNWPYASSMSYPYMYSSSSYSKFAQPSAETLEKIENAQRILDVYGVKSECGFVSVVEVAELIRKLA